VSGHESSWTPRSYRYDRARLVIELRRVSGNQQRASWHVLAFDELTKRWVVVMEGDLAQGQTDRLNKGDLSAVPVEAIERMNRQVRGKRGQHR
jgi:hypothetical protein